LLEDWYRKLCGKNLNELHFSLNICKDEDEKICLAKTFKVLAPLFSKEQIEIALVKTQEMLMDTDTVVSKKALSSLYKLTSYDVKVKLIDSDKILCKFIEMINSSKGCLAIEIVDRLAHQFSEKQHHFIIESLITCLMIKNETQIIIQAIKTLKKCVSLLSAQQRADLICQLYNKLCSALLEAEKDSIHDQIIIALRHLASVFSSHQRMKVMDCLFKYIASASFSSLPVDINLIVKTFTDLLIHSTSFEKANLYVQLMTLNSAKIKGHFVPLIDQLYASLYELPKVLPSRDVNNVIEGYLAPTFC